MNETVAAGGVIPLSFFAARMPHYAYFVERFRRVDELSKQPRSGVVWNVKRLACLRRVVALMDANWELLHARQKEILEANGFDTEVDLYFRQIHSYMEAMATLVNGLDETNQAMLQRLGAKLH